MLQTSCGLLYHTAPDDPAQSIQRSSQQSKLLLALSVVALLLGSALLIHRHPQQTITHYASVQRSKAPVPHLDAAVHHARRVPSGPFDPLSLLSDPSEPADAAGLPRATPFDAMPVRNALQYAREQHGEMTFSSMTFFIARLLTTIFVIAAGVATSSGAAHNAKERERLGYVMGAVTGLTEKDAPDSDTASPATPKPSEPSPAPKRSLLARVLGRPETADAGDAPLAKVVIEDDGIRAETPRFQFRLRTWHVFVLVALTLYLGGWVLNSVIMGLLSRHTDAVVLGQEQVEEVANALVNAEKQLRYDIIMGHTPKMDETQLMARLREVGLHLEEEERHNMLQGAANTITDVILGFCLTLSVLLNKTRVADVMDKISKRFMSLSNTTQAFLLLLMSDVIVGYHSSDGWFTVLKLIGQHYGWSERGYESIISIFVAIVPVGLDVAFKFWVFKELRRLSPSTQVILGEIDRH